MGLSSDELLANFEHTCSLGPDAAKILSMSPEEANRLLDIFHHSVEGDLNINEDVKQSIDLLEKIAAGKKVVIFESDKLNSIECAEQFALLQKTLEGIESHYVGISSGIQKNWVQRSIEVVHFKDFSDKIMAKIRQAIEAGDLTTVMELNEQLAKECLQLGMDAKAFEIRARMAHIPLPDNHPLADMPSALERGSEGKPMSRMGAYFQNLDTGSVKMGTLHGARRSIAYSDNPAQQPVDVMWFDFLLTHHARDELGRTIQAIQDHPQEFEQAIGRRIAIYPHVSGPMPAYDERRGVFSAHRGMQAECLWIEIEGVGNIIVHTDPAFHSYYNRVDLQLYEQSNQGPNGLRNMQSILSTLGLGTVLCPSRPEDEERKKTFILLHAYFPKLSYEMERDPENYRISAEELRTKIISQEPKTAELFTKYLDEHPELLVKTEMYPGRQTYMIADMGDQIREHACGLLFGTKAVTCRYLSWGGNREEAETKFHVIAKDYVQKLKAGVTMESNREAYVSRGDQVGGTSPVDDAKVGGLDCVFTRIIPKGYDGKIDMDKDDMPFCDSGIRVLVDADVMGYASCYALQTDSFGARIELPYEKHDNDSPGYAHRWSLPEFALKMQEYAEKDIRRKQAGQLLQKSPRQSALQNEVMIRDLISTQFIRGLLVPRQEMKDILVDEFRQAGCIEQRDGVECVVLPGCVKPIDEFIHVGDVPRLGMWAKGASQ